MICKNKYWLFTDVPMFPVEGFNDASNLGEFLDYWGLKIKEVFVKDYTDNQGVLWYIHEIHATPIS